MVPVSMTKPVTNAMTLLLMLKVDLISLQLY